MKRRNYEKIEIIGRIGRYGTFWKGYEYSHGKIVRGDIKTII